MALRRESLITNTIIMSEEIIEEEVIEETPVEETPVEEAVEETPIEEPVPEEVPVEEPTPVAPAAVVVVIQSREQVEDKIRANIAVMDGTTELFGRALFGRTWAEIENQITQLKRNIELAKAEVNAVPVGVVTPVTPTPTSTPTLTPEPVVPTAEELARDAWLEQWWIYERANRAMKALAEAGFEPTEEETTRFNALKNWVGANRRPEYSQYL
jgi:hypothetical protein